MQGENRHVVAYHVDKRKNLLQVKNTTPESKTVKIVTIVHSVLNNDRKKAYIKRVTKETKISANKGKLAQTLFISEMILLNALPNLSLRFSSFRQLKLQKTCFGPMKCSVKSTLSQQNSVRLS